MKLSIGKLEIDRPVSRLFAELVGAQGMELLPVGHEHCIRLSSLPLHHRDPFDRMLVVQAQQDNLPLLTADLSSRGSRGFRSLTFWLTFRFLSPLSLILLFSVTYRTLCF